MNKSSFEMRHRRCLLLTTILGLLIQGALSEAPLDASSLPLEHRGGYGGPSSIGGTYGPPPPSPQSPLTGGDLDSWPLASPSDSPQIKHLQVQCEKTHMRVNIEFDRPFYGMIFSKGFYSDSHCVHLKPGTGHLSATFEIFLNSCGMSSSSSNHNGSPTPSGSYVENTIIVQYDPYVQEVWDQARKLRCTWYDFYEKAVTFRPFQVDMLHAVTANFLGDNLQCWMQIQVGKGPWASEVSGIVKIGQTMTMVLAIKDDENKFDMLVRNCVAHDGKRAPIQLVDQYGCVVRPKIMSRFQKIKNFGPSASVVSFAYFQAFKFPDSMNVHFQCVIQVCRYNCPEPKCAGGSLGSEYGAPLLPPAGGGNTIASGEYGAPPLLNGDYGLPSQEYGLPQAYPDPRHPSSGSDQSGAYSENQPDSIPVPQQQNSAQSTTSPVQQQDLHLPPPPPPGHHHGVYNTVKRKSGTYSENQLDNTSSQQNTVPSTHHYNNIKRKSGEPEADLATLGGRPRSVEGMDEELRGARKRRNLDLNTFDIPMGTVHRIYKRGAQEMTDVNTSRIIRVVAPGDVDFALNSIGAGNNETVIVQQASRGDSEEICVSVTSFAAGLVMLLLVIVVASLVAAFLFVRVRSFDRKGAEAAQGGGGIFLPAFATATMQSTLK